MRGEIGHDLAQHAETSQRPDEAALSRIMHALAAAHPLKNERGSLSVQRARQGSSGVSER
jgi:hypothetical protein